MWSRWRAFRWPATRRNPRIVTELDGHGSAPRLASQGLTALRCMPQSLQLDQRLRAIRCVRQSRRRGELVAQLCERRRHGGTIAFGSTSASPPDSRRDRVDAVPVQSPSTRLAPVLCMDQ